MRKAKYFFEPQKNLQNQMTLEVSKFLWSVRDGNRTLDTYLNIFRKYKIKYFVTLCRKPKLRFKRAEFSRP
jgi:hypothetical protein